LGKFLDISGMVFLMLFILIAPFLSFWLEVIPHCSWLSEAKIGNFPAGITSDFNQPYCGETSRGKMLASFLTFFSPYIGLMAIFSVYSFVQSLIHLEFLRFFVQLPIVLLVWFVIFSMARAIILMPIRVLRFKKWNKNAAN